MATNEVHVNDVKEVVNVKGAFDVSRVIKIVNVALSLAKNIAERMKWEQMAGVLGWISTVLNDPELLEAVLSLYELLSSLNKEQVSQLVDVVKSVSK